MIAGATFGCVANTHCLSSSVSSQSDRALAAGSALAGGVLGLAGGVLLTRHVDDSPIDSSGRSSTPLPMATFAPMRDSAGRVSPAVSALGFF